MTRLNKTFIIIAMASIALLFPVLGSLTSITGNSGDVFLHYYPLKYLVQEHLMRGEMPLWNPYIFAGQPLLANPQSAVFYPFSMLFCFLPLPAAFNYFYLLHFVLAGMFFMLFMSAQGFRRTSSLLGALAFSLSSFMVYKVPAGHPVAFSGYAWLPLVVMIIEAMRKDAGSRPLPVFLAVVLSLQFLSGHTFPVYVSLVVILLHLLYARLSYWQSLLAAAGSCMALSALQLIPTMELAQAAERSNWPLLTASYSLSMKNLANLLMPNYFGNIIDGTYIYPDNPSFFFERHALYIGIIPALLAAGGLYLSLKEKRFFFPLLSVAGILLALGFHTPVYRFLYRVLPGMDLLRVPARFYVMTVMGLCVLAAVAWERYFGRGNRPLKAVLLAVIAGDLLIWGHRFIYPESMSAYRTKSDVAAALDPLYRSVTQPERIAPNRSMLYHNYNLNGYEAIFLVDFVRYLGLQEKQVMSATGLARMDLNSPTARGFAVRYGITLNDGEGRLLGSYPGGVKVYDNGKALPRLFVPQTLRDFNGADVYEEIGYLSATRLTPVQELTVTGLPSDFPRYSRGGRLLGYASSSDRITAEVAMAAPGALVFSEMYYPGWRAYAQGRETRVIRGNKVFRTLLLPEGSYRGKEKIYLVFHPFSWRLGLLITIAALVTLALFMLKYSMVLPL